MPDEKDTKEVATQPEPEVTNATEDLTRVNSKASAHGAPEPISDEATANEGQYYLSGRSLWLVHTGVLLSVLLVALDQSIVSTALPRISSEFNALEELTWIVSTYFLTQAGLMLFFGQVLTIVSSKWVFIFCIVVFEIGSLICAVAPNIDVLIFGRAIQGVGGSGGFIAILTIIAQVARIEIRPILLGSFGGVFGLASIFGPLLGGVFTDRLTWRWCFWINLPFGAVSLLSVLIWLPSHPPLHSEHNEGKSIWQKWLSLDWIGTVIALGMTVCLLLALTWGGITKPWDSATVIALFVTSGVLFILLILWERRLGSRAMMPLSIFMRRTQISAGIATFTIMLISIILTYYMPFFYQAKGRSAEQSGIDILPLMMSMVVGSGLSGWLNSVTGRYVPFLILGPVMYAIGGGLMFTIDEHTSNAKLIGYQILVGFGEGLAFQQPLIAIQAEYANVPELIPQASSLVTYLQLLGAVCGISIAGAVFGNQLSKELAAYAAIIPPEVITGVKQSVTVIFMLPVAFQGIVIKAYIAAVDYAFLVVVPGAGITIISALFVKNYNLKERGVKPGAAVA